MSATDAEYIAASEAAMEAVWIRKFISGLGIVPTINEPIKMFYDNSDAFFIANKPGVQKGAIHYHRRYHYVCECIELGDINLLKVHTDDNLADPFTKALPKGKLTQHARSIGLRLASSFIIEALGDGILRSCLSRPSGVGDIRETRRGSRVEVKRKIKVGSWNVGSLTGKLLELVDVLERHKVDIACFKETKSKGSRNKEGNGYKLWYLGSQTARNGVGVILRACLKDKVVHVNRCSGMIILLKLVIEGEIVNVISAYTPQVGLSGEEKKTFWDSLDEVMMDTSTDQRLFLGGDLNMHIGATTEGYLGVHRGFGCGVRNKEGRSILDFATAHDLVVESGECGAKNPVEEPQCTIKDAVKDSLGVAIRTSKTHTAHMESWWLCEKVQSKVTVKQERISQTEVRTALQKMGIKKAVGPDQIPIEAWKSLGEEDLEKAYDSVPRELIWKTLIDKRASRRYIKVIRDMYDGVETRREALEDKGLRVSREKTEYLICDFGNMEIAHNKEVDICIGDKILQPKESFRYLRSMLHKPVRIDEDVSHRIKAAWLKWRAATRVLCDRNVPIKLKGKFYRVAIRPSILYGSECWPIMKTLANRMEVTKLRMLRWTCGKIMLDMIPNEVYRAKFEVETIINKMREGRLRRRGRPKLKWQDRVKLDMKELLLFEDMTSDRNEWRCFACLVSFWFFCLFDPFASLVSDMRVVALPVALLH
ncbi:retrovirus-related pol polyprotein LINE-1 [Tanacetum coccineum]